MNNAADPVLPPPDNARRMHTLVKLSHQTTTIRKAFRCSECGFPVIVHSRMVQMIYEGKMVKNDHGIEVLCGRCKMIYVFV